MKDIFIGYYSLSKEEYTSLWKDAIFVFDTNVLLNLYEYQSSTRETLFAALDTLSERIWIPYHVGLEYQRNRLDVIVRQHNRFKEVKDAAESTVDRLRNTLDELKVKTRHSLIDPDKIISRMEEIKNSFLEELDALEEKGITVSSNDHIREKVDILFQDKIGRPPKNQQELDALYCEGEKRYKYGVPPGYKDAKKDANEFSSFYYKGLEYKSIYGDLIIWNQILDHVKTEKIRDVVFVTEDSKSDWWRKIGSHTVGVRPELFEEISRDAGVERFTIYNTLRFLEYAKKEIGLEVEKDAIEDIKEISSNQEKANRFRTTLFYDDEFEFEASSQRNTVEKAVSSWLSEKYGIIVQSKVRPNLFACFQGKKRVGVVFIKRTSETVNLRKLRIFISNAKTISKKEHFDEMVLIILLGNAEDALDFKRSIADEFSSAAVRLVVGSIQIDDASRIGVKFAPAGSVFD